jgi:hypothetical protein
MNRRRLLGSLGTAAVLGLAGCTSREDAGDGGDTGDDRTTATASPPPTGAAVDASGNSSVVRGPRGEVELPVDDAEIRRVIGKDRIPAITEPSFGSDWGSVEYALGDEDRVIGVVRDGAARAYPLAVLNWHEVVNDDFGGPLLVTYCPLCGTGVTAERRVDGQVTTFGVSGRLWRSDLVMYDSLTDSLWSQILATAIRGDRTGDRLSLVPSSLTTWGQWRTDHPDTEVLLPPPRSGTVVSSLPRNYDSDPYAGYEDSRSIGVAGGGGGDFDDDRLHPKAQVIGVATETAAVAYPFARVSEVGVVNDTVGDLPVVVAAGAGETLSAFDRRVDGTTLTFTPAGAGRMRAGGSTWTRTTGTAVDGPYEGVTLDQAARVSTEFWFAWLNFHPDTAVYGTDG